ncbi:ATP-binding protein [Candidatus Protochlamydia phocaeensis]|uniref:ATP-binding protein n=1 Tax=Candidatus Protochlamydia phocaeensis TaxID=1414722 RepID=UPI000838861D|nr:ATP-binding protein [Candidatus Protochlamydia phocaeensis]
MNEDEDKPNPDELLKAIQKEEEQKNLGQLKIFFGMAAGVGKTYAMLEAAQQKLKEGNRVVIGVINTHGRKETEALLQGLPLIPEKWVKYKETVFEEMDLETILRSRPDLVLVDELAHTNVPGSKHSKRWQDVIEILDAGINVYTTLNVQHIESRKDLVESLTGIQVRETVPDLILERASSIELIDLPPPDLLRRLNEGKVYLGDQSKRAAENFFKEENLMALREIALRFTAEKVDHDLHGILQGKGWKTRERLMVAISSSPSSEGLIRAARRLAFELDAPWIAVYVDMGQTLSDQDQIRLNRHLNLARELGAEVITTHDLDVAAALQRIAGQRDITRIVIGRPPAKKGFFANLFQGSFIDRLENENKQIDLVIMRQDKLTHIYQRSFSQIYQFSGSLKAYGLVLAFGAVSTLIGLLVSPLIGYKLVGFIFLFSLLILSFFVGRGPIFLAAVLSAICWDLLFIPPIFTPWIFDTEDAALLVSYFFIAAVLGTITSRMREQEQFLSKREETMERLYEIEREIANATNVQYLRLNVASHLEHHFPGKFDILIKSPDNQLIFDSQLPLLNTEKEKVAAIWVFQNGKIGGWSTDTLPSSAGMYFPIKFFKATVGVLVYFPSRERPLSTDEINFLQTVAQQLGIYLERSIFEERVRRQDYSRQIERMHQSIFHSVNRSFYFPLEGILKINQQIQQDSADPHIRLLARQMEQFIFNFKLTLDNVITVSELESGFVHFERKPNSIKDLVDKSLGDVKPFMNGHPIEVQIPSETLFLPFDFNLLRLALKNLILNALEYSEPSAPICINLEVSESSFRLSVLDEGPGIPEAILPLIFNKFYQASESAKGLGLGLAIVKAVVDIHQGKIEVKNREIKGTEFSLILPIS